MRAQVSSPSALFDSRVCYEIPTYQRPYVWDRDDQWEPLWEDIRRTAESVLAAPEGTPEAELASHFLGAVVLKQLRSSATEANRFSVIDGQQRLTTLQLLLDAAELVVSEHGLEEDAETLQELVTNRGVRFKGTHHRFKLWPSRVDRPAFEHAMDNSMAIPDHLEDSRVHQAHDFFRTAVETWADDGDSEERPRRLSALTIALIQRLQIVEISLGDDDDDQVIFETLNDRGTPLLAADLIKNYVFQKGEDLRADVERWADEWAEFDDEWWRSEVSQGRLLRSRIDLFLQYWLTMREQDEIAVEAVFRRFRGYAGRPMSSLATAEDFLAHMLRDAATFRDFAQMDKGTPEGRYYDRVVEALELGATIPVLLWMLSDNHAVPDEQVETALATIESWVVRRTLLRQTLSNLNRMVVQLLKELDSHPYEQAGEVTREFLLAQTADATSWPTDEQLRASLPATKLYGSLKQQRLRMVLQALEVGRRTARNEDVTIRGKLEIEHVMPRAWRVHWMSSAMRDPIAAEARNELINTLGNLTLVTSPMNKELSNRPWTDAQARKLPPGGKKHGMGKKSLIKGSLLALNHDIVAESAWNEGAIRSRSNALCELAIATWPRPESSGDVAT